MLIDKKSLHRILLDSMSRQHMYVKRSFLVSCELLPDIHVFFFTLGTARVFELENVIFLHVELIFEEAVRQIAVLLCLLNVRVRLLKQ